MQTQFAATVISVQPPHSRRTFFLASDVYFIILKGELVYSVSGTVIITDELLLLLFLLSRMQLNDARQLWCDWFTLVSSVSSFSSELSVCLFLQAVETNLASKDSHWVYANEVRPSTHSHKHRGELIVAASFRLLLVCLHFFFLWSI